MSEIRISVQGVVPQAKGSKRGYVVRRKGAAGGAEGTKAYRAVLVEGGHGAQDKLKIAWERAVADAAEEQRPAELLDGPLSVTAVFWMPRPKHETKAQRLRTWHTVPIDVDKALRAVLDPLKGRIFVDDARIAIARAEKRYCPYGQPWRVGVALTVSRLPESA